MRRYVGALFDSVNPDCCCCRCCYPAVLAGPAVALPQTVIAKKDEDFTEQTLSVTQRIEYLKEKIAALQQKLSQKGFELIVQQHEVTNLKQQLDAALARARRAEGTASAMK